MRCVPVLRCLLLVVALLAVSASAQAHPEGRSSFGRVESGDIAFYLSVVAHVVRIDEEVLLFAEVRDAATHALVDGPLGGSARLGGKPGSPQPIEWAREGPGRYQATFVFPARGTWVLEMATADAAAAFNVQVYDASRHWIDFRPMAAQQFVAGELAPVRLAVVDHVAGRPIALPDDAVLHVERWDERHEQRLDAERLSIRSTEAPWLGGLDHAFSREGAYDLWVEIPSLGIGRHSQAPFDVHVEPVEPVEPPHSPRAQAPPTTHGIAPVALALFAGAAVGTRFSRPRA